MMTDPIADMLTRLRNANTAFHDEVLMPSSKLKEALARILEREGYIAGWDVSKDATKPGSGASRSPASGCTRVRATCPASSAGWASRSSRPTRGS